MTNLFAGYRPTFPPPAWDVPLTKLQEVIRGGAGRFDVFIRDGTKITGYLVNISSAVERAFVLTPREALPKITASVDLFGARKFTGTNGLGATITGGNSESARQSAALWLAIAGLLEAEEKKAADEAKTKAAAAKAKVEARLKRLDELAYEHFGKDFDELGTNKASAIEEIYRLEQEVKERTPYDERDAA